VMTHAHNDHTAEFEAIHTLLHEYNHPRQGEDARPKRRVNLYLSQGASRKFTGFLPLKGCDHIDEVVTLNRGRKDRPPGRSLVGEYSANDPSVLPRRCTDQQILRRVRI
jgi:hypothetical protein